MTATGVQGVQGDKLAHRTSLRAALWSRWDLSWMNKGRFREEKRKISARQKRPCDSIISYENKVWSQQVGMKKV